MPTRRFLLASAATLAALTATAPTATWADEPMPVVATFSILGDMVAQIGGEHIALTTLVGPDGDTHVYQPTPQAARAVAEADLLIMNGLEFEGWLERLVEAASFTGPVVVGTTGIEAIAYDEHDDHEGHDDHGDEHDDHDDHGDKHDDHDDHGDEDHADGKDHDDHHDEEEHAEDKEHDDHHDHDDHADHGEHDDHDKHDDHDDHAGHGDHHGHDHGAFDPHAWHSVENAIIYANNIAAGLSQADPENASAYYANLSKFVAELEALQAEVAVMMSAVPDDKRTVVTSHDAFGYFAQAYDLVFEAPQGLSTDSEASAADVAELITQIREEGVSAVFIESVTDNRLMQQIASETGATIGGTLYAGALSQADGPASTYIDMIRHNATTLSNALSN